MDEDRLEVTTEAGELSVPADATPAQTAAIAATVSAHITDQRLAAAQVRGEDDDETDWNGERFQFAGRIEGLTGHSTRVPQNAPTDRWTAAGRTDRYDP